ncbi:MAG: sulfotransferase [Alphaproteobacteria bacterium]
MLWPIDEAETDRMNRKQRRAGGKRRPITGPGAKSGGDARRAAAAYFRQGVAAMRAGRPDAAATAYRRALRHVPDAPESHVNLGSALKAGGRPEAAVASYRRALELDPDLAAGHNNLGNALRDLGRLEDAAAAYRKALARDPDYAEAHGNLGLTLNDLGDPEAAVSACRRAVELAPSLVEAHGNLATALARIGRLDDAGQALCRALRLRPDDPALHCQRARLLLQQGRMSDAERAVRRALAIDPGCALAYFELADIKRFDAGDGDLAAMERLATRLDERPVRQRIDLHFALAKALEDAGRYDDASRHLNRGNALMRRLVPFDIARQEALFTTIADVFDEDFAASRDGTGDPSTVPVFVVGMPRSGTTLVEQILGSHPMVTAAGELRDLSRIARGVSGATDPAEAVRGLAALTEADRAAMGRAYVDAVRAVDPDADRVVDKMPSNFLRIGLIAAILPNARIIHCRRDPADTCLSCYQQQFGGGQAFSYDLDDLGRYYRLYRGLIEHWRRVLPGRVLEIDYEDVVADAGGAARRLIAHCDLPWDAACLRFHDSARPVRTASATQVRRPIYSTSVGRWRRFEAHLAPLLRHLDRLP